ncbi:MAG: LacI family DNA-binding transcriptional regulator [Mesorhizobium sp.]|nr:LacI family DNA-binding transcriptional regulator [Mesorhizobium sp.]
MTTAFPTIQDVARAAQVSTATVSRALSFPERVSETTRMRVFDAVEQTGYSVNQTARNLRRKTTGAIVVLVPNIGNPFFSRILAGIESAASQAGYTVLICDTLQPRAGEDMLLEYMRNNRADGLIILDGSLPSRLFESGAQGRRRPPTVFACEWREATGLPSVRFDNVGGARLAVGHLAALGHEQIGHVLGPPGNVLTEARRAGYLTAMSERGLAVRSEWILNGDFSLDAGVLAARRWLALPARPTAMFLANDEMACGFISELHRSGVEVPRDVSVVGFDDIDIAERFIPTLTTIRQPRTEIGVAAFAELHACIQDREKGMPRTGEVRLLPAELIVRESTKALKR